MHEAKIENGKPAFIVVALIFLFALGFSLFINLPVTVSHFLFADQAVYYAMTQSIAFDGDLEYTKKDLIRYYEDFNSGPQGIFLKKARTGKIFYAKSWAYSLFAAPFVRIFGYNGIFVFHSCLLLLVLLMGYAFLSLANPPFRSLAFVLSFLFASIAGVYFVWISPDFFNLCLVFAVIFLWQYKVKRRELISSRTTTGRWQAFLNSPATDYLAAALAGLAVFSKPPNIVLIGPLVLSSLINRKLLKSLLLVMIFAITLVFFFGTNFLLTSDWNYQGGERKTFIGNFPLEKDTVTFESTGYPMTSENYFERFLIPPKFILYNIFYYFFGRFTGIAWYYFPALLALLLFFAARPNLDRLDQAIGEDRLEQAVVQERKDMVELLIGAGANVNVRDRDGFTPLHWAAYGFTQVAEVLLANGAKVNARDAWGRTPLGEARIEGHAGMVELLRKHGARE